MRRANLTLLFTCLILRVLNAEEIDTTKISNTFQLGEIIVLAPRTNNTVSQTLNLQMNNINVSEALRSVPSVIFANMGGRFEPTIIVRGFDIRGIPVFVDGIPLQMPYDGDIDLGQLSTFDYSQVSLTKGIAPMSLGPNTIGGSINLVSFQPTDKVDVQAITGWGSGNTYEYGINAGSRGEKFFVQGSYYERHTDYFMLSHSYQPTTYQSDRKRDNSYSDFRKVNLKIGYIAAPDQEFTLNYQYQNNAKGNPPYSGIDDKQSTRFWQWPVWERQSLYFISKNKINANNDIKTSIYTDKFYNVMKSYDDQSYTTQNKKYAFTSIYNDRNLGGNVILSNTSVTNNQLNFSVQINRNEHKSHNEGNPQLTNSDFVWSAGLDDRCLINEKWSLTGGLSYARQKSLKEEDQVTDEGITEFPQNSHQAVNAQLSANWIATQQFSMSAYVARKTRFATLKERYSYKMGQGLPNPDLQPEKATHIDISLQYGVSKNLSFNSSMYYIRLHDVIQSVDGIEGNLTQIQNAGEARFSGFDVSLHYLILKNLDLTTSYSFIIQKNKTNPELRFTDVPKHKAWSNLSYQPTNWAKVSLTHEYYSRRYSRSYGITADEFHLFNLQGSLSWKQFTLYTGIKNLFDTNYAYAEGYPEAGRNYFTKLVFELN